MSGQPTGWDSGPGEATKFELLPPQVWGPCVAGAGGRSYLPQQVSVVLHQLTVLLLQLAVPLLIGLRFPWMGKDQVRRLPG